VAVIDDDPDAVMTLLTLLRSQGYVVEGFGSAKSALNAFEAFQPDVVISDVAMPSINGWDLAREVRRLMGKRPTLIGISGHYMKDPDKDVAELAGFNFYFTKPYDPRTLMALLAPLAPAR
jgi:CheY-like chemotaxis protein